MHQLAIAIQTVIATYVYATHWYASTVQLLLCCEPPQLRKCSSDIRIQDSHLPSSYNCTVQQEISCAYQYDSYVCMSLCCIGMGMKPIYMLERRTPMSTASNCAYPAQNFQPLYDYDHDCDSGLYGAEKPVHPFNCIYSYNNTETQLTTCYTVQRVFHLGKFPQFHESMIIQQGFALEILLKH